MWKNIHYDHYRINKSGTVKRIKAACGAVVGRTIQPYGSDDQITLSRDNVKTRVNIRTLLKRAFG